MIKYRKGYKYQIAEDCYSFVGIYGYDIDTDYIRLNRDGWLINKKGYAWDGASGPTFDTPSTIRPSAAHDALYQLARQGYLPKEMHFTFDEILRRLCVECGMWKIRAYCWEKGVNLCGSPNLDPSSEREILTAP